MTKNLQKGGVKEKKSYINTKRRFYKNLKKDKTKKLMGMYKRIKTKQFF